MEGLITEYGYLGVLVGAFLDSPTVLVLGGFAAARGYLGPEGVLAGAFAGALLSGQVKFLVGRRYGAALLARRPALRRHAARLDALLARHRLGLALAFRFLYGLRAATPLALGAGTIGTGRFFVLNAAGATLWVLAFTLAGLFFGNAAALLVERFRHLDLAAMAAIVALGAAARLLYLALRARRGAAPEMEP